MIEGWWQGLAGGAFPIGATLLIGWLAERPSAQRRAGSPSEGASAIPRWLTLGLMALCWFAAANVLHDIARDPPLTGKVSGAMVALALALAGGYFAAIVLKENDVVSWDSAGLKGPTSLLWFGRYFIAWPDVASAGTSLGNWYVADGAGRRVYWSMYFSGYPAIAAAIRHHRPDLALPNGAD